MARGQITGLEKRCNTEPSVVAKDGGELRLLYFARAARATQCLFLIQMEYDRTSGYEHE
jgi:hypothetical protein